MASESKAPTALRLQEASSSIDASIEDRRDHFKCSLAIRQPAIARRRERLHAPVTIVTNGRFVSSFALYSSLAKFIEPDSALRSAVRPAIFSV